jgi:hypothetical protein
MPFRRVTYDFRTPLGASRPRAYRWATDYRPDDFDLAGIPGKRHVERLADDLILLTDSFSADPFDSRPGSRTVKQKVVHLYPRRWAWTSTHTSGPARYSQFLYELEPRGRSGSTLHFTGSQVERVARAPTPATVAQRARELRREDSEFWVKLADALARDLR